MSLPSINCLHLIVAEIQPVQDFIGQGHYSKVKPRSHHDVAHLQLQPMSLPSINYLHLTVSEIQHGQDFIGQGHYGKVKTRSHHYIVPTLPNQCPYKYHLPTPYGFRDIARTRFYRLRSIW